MPIKYRYIRRPCLKPLHFCGIFSFICSNQALTYIVRRTDCFVFRKELQTSAGKTSPALICALHADLWPKIVCFLGKGFPFKLSKRLSLSSKSNWVARTFAKSRD